MQAYCSEGATRKSSARPVADFKNLAIRKRYSFFGLTNWVDALSKNPTLEGVSASRHRFRRGLLDRDRRLSLLPAVILRRVRREISLAGSLKPFAKLLAMMRHEFGGHAENSRKRIGTTRRGRENLSLIDALTAQLCRVATESGDASPSGSRCPVVTHPPDLWRANMLRRTPWDQLICSGRRTPAPQDDPFSNFRGDSGRSDFACQFQRVLLRC